MKSEHDGDTVVVSFNILNDWTFTNRMRKLTWNAGEMFVCNLIEFIWFSKGLPSLCKWTNLDIKKGKMLHTIKIYWKLECWGNDIDRGIMHTYIHNWPLQAFSQDYWTTFLYHLCLVLILYLSRGTYSLKSTPNDRFFEKLFHGNFLFSFRVFASNLLRGSRRRNIFCISFWWLA